MSVVGITGHIGCTHTKWRAIIKGEARTALGELELGLESVHLPPKEDDILLDLWKTDTHGVCYVLEKMPPTARGILVICGSLLAARGSESPVLGESNR